MLILLAQIAGSDAPVPAAQPVPPPVRNTPRIYAPPPPPPPVNMPPRLRNAPPVVTSNAPARPGTSEVRAIGPWTLRMDETIGHACYIVRLYPQGVLFRTGYLPATGKTILIVGSAGLRSLVHDKSYRLRIQFDGQPPLEEEAKGLAILGSIVVLAAPTDSTPFLADLGSHRALSLSVDGMPMAKLQLDGIKEALRGMAECQKTADTAHDPFLGSQPGPTAAPSDPFKP